MTVGRIRGAVSWPALLELSGLCGLAIVQPVLDVMGRAPEFFLFRGATGRDIVALAVVLVFAPALVLWLASTVVGVAAGHRAQRAVHVLLLAAFGGVLGVQLAKQVFDERAAAAVAAGVLAAVVAVALSPRPGVRLWLRYLAPAPAVFAALFLLTSPVSELVNPSAASASDAATGASDVPVVLMVFDEWPLTSLLDSSGQIDERLYPNLARLAARSTFYRNTTAVSLQTPVAVPAVLAGRSPRAYLAPVVSQYPRNIFTLLGGTHAVDGHEVVTALCPSPLCPAESGRPDVSVLGLLQDSWGVWRDVVSPSTSGDRDLADTLVEETVTARGNAGRIQPRDANDLAFLMHVPKKPRQFQAFLDGIQAGEPPTLHAIHALLPHQPWRYLPSGQRYPWDDPRSDDGALDTEPWPWMQVEQRMLLQAVYVDGLVGQVLDRLEAAGLMDRALIAITADHGTSFIPGQAARAVTDESAAEVLWVPLIIKAPHQRAARVDDRNLLTIDVLPTIADLLDVKTDWDFEGLSAAGTERRSPGEKTYYEKPGIKRTIDPARWWPALLDGWVDDFTRPEAGPAGLFGVGPYRDLVGTPVAEHPRLASQGATFVLDERGARRMIDLQAGILPSQLLGELVTPSAAGPAEWAVIAANGRIAGVTGFFAGETRRFAAMVSTGALVDGMNQFEMFLVRGEPGDVRLEPVAFRRWRTEG